MTPLHRSTVALAALVVAPSLACAAAASPSTRFADVTATHVPADDQLHALDGALLDADGDGDLDVAVAVENGANRLYRNDGAGRLVHVPGAFGEVRGDYEHVRSADFDRDGHADVLFIAEETEQHALFLGNGDGTFKAAGARLPGSSQANGLAVGDVNGDGLPDILIGNTTEGKSGKAQPFLWLNDAKRPSHFIDATASHLPTIDVQAQGMTLADLDGDGDLDLVIASQDPLNRLLLNDGTGRFVDATARLGAQPPTETREVHALDVDADGRLDLVFFNLTSNNQAWDKDPQTRLLINQGDATFVDETDTRLPTHRFSSWGGSVIDFNGDGAPDLVVGAIEVPGFVPQQVRAWQNDGRGVFRDVTATVMPASAVGRSWSMAQGDLDGDGRPDLFIGGWQSQARLLLGR